MSQLKISTPQDSAQASEIALLSGRSAVERDELIDALEAERSHAVNWWTFLNEMRCRGELPDWVRKQLVGSHPDMDRFQAAQGVVNTALFGAAQIFPSSAKLHEVFFPRLGALGDQIVGGAE